MPQALSPLDYFQPARLTWAWETLNYTIIGNASLRRFLEDLRRHMLDIIRQPQLAANEDIIAELIERVTKLLGTQEVNENYLPLIGLTVMLLSLSLVTHEPDDIKRKIYNKYKGEPDFDLLRQSPRLS